MQKTRLSFAILTSILVIIFLMQPIAQVAVVEANPFMFGPEWQISLPEQSYSKTYQTSTVPIEVQIYTPTDYPKIIKIYYILDLNYSSNNNPQKSLTISNPQSITYYAKPSISYLATGTSDNLSNGTHRIDAYAVNTKGETLKSNTRTFQVNATSIYPTTNTEQPLATSNLTIALVIATIAIITGASLAVLAYKRRKKV
jgi:hypothetical protein